MKEQVDYYLTVFLVNARNASLPEWIAVGCSVAQVLLAWANRASNYLFGILGTAVYTYIFAAGGLYADAGLNVYYFAMSAYGLWHWNRGRRARPVSVEGGQLPPRELPITFSTTHDWLIAAGIAAAAFALWSAILIGLAKSQVPFWDAGLTALAWAGMWLLARRKVENWLWLNASNALAMPLYFFKGWMLTTALTGFLFVVACFGFFTWRKMALRAKRKPFADA